MSTLPKRKYDSSRRRESARQTRLKIAEAARALFQERGYDGASIEAIAAQAGVSRETVYAAFGNKRNILAFLLDISVGGDDRPLRLIERPEVQANLRDRDQHRQVAAFAARVTEVLARAAPIFEIMRVAGKTETEIADRTRDLYEERMQNMRRFAEALAANGPLRDALDTRRAAETIWALSSPDLFQLMIGYRRWTPDEYAAWLAQTLEAAILPGFTRQR
jgi:TetR/AcrR family transcriptional regulator, regulator of autoinduction and epiphytic fitness